MARNVLVLNGPNLNMLGTRQPEIYGTETLADVEALCDAVGRQLGMAVTCRQSNVEGELVTWIQEARSAFDGILINAGAYTHTSIAILDALKASERPTVEVHMSNIHARESFRHSSYVSHAAVGMVCGFGSDGYRLGLMALDNLIAGGAAAQGGSS